jgi:hypothetical protein
MRSIPGLRVADGQRDSGAPPCAGRDVAPFFCREGVEVRTVPELGVGATGQLARRFDVSTRQVPVIAGATAAVRWLDSEVGWKCVHEATSESCARLAAMLAETEGPPPVDGARRRSCHRSRCATHAGTGRGATPGAADLQPNRCRDEAGGPCGCRSVLEAPGRRRRDRQRRRSTRGGAAAPVRLDKCRDAADRVELVEPEDCGGQLLHPLVREHEPGVAAELLEHPLARHLARVT